jgi:hypothetical protein
LVRFCRQPLQCVRISREGGSCYTDREFREKTTQKYSFTSIVSPVSQWRRL